MEAARGFCTERENLCSDERKQTADDAAECDPNSPRANSTTSRVHSAHLRAVKTILLLAS
jgi:hypothetical protein